MALRQKIRKKHSKIRKNNMAYSFPHVEIKVYPKTFLKDVRIGLLFSKVPLTDALQQLTSEFFTNEFGLPNIKMEEMPKAASVFSKDNLIRFVFGLSGVELSIKRGAYRSFVDTTRFLQIVYKYLSILNQETVSKIYFSKFNELGYEVKGDKPVAEVMEGVFSENLLKTMTTRDRQTQKNLSRWEKMVKYSGNDTTSSIFTIEYGFSKKPEGALVSSLSLKTLIESQVEIPSSKVHDVLTEYNQVLDNAFHWCVSNQVLNAMKKE